MIAHRDYANYMSSCQVQKFKNRISWVSPGGLPPGMTVENILTAQASRNPNILSILYEAGYVEAFGQGLDTVVRVLTEEEMTPPHFQDTGVSFIVTVYGRPLELMQPQNETYGSLTDAQRMILTLIRSKGDVPPRDIRTLFADRAERSIQRDLKALMEANLIVATGGSRSLRYRIRENGD
jgi:ATP-dependent DNA helicase RecG